MVTPTPIASDGMAEQMSNPIRLGLEKDDPSGLMRAQRLMLQDDPAGALAALLDVPLCGAEQTHQYGLRIRALTLTGRVEDAETLTHDWARIFPGSPMPFRVLARALDACSHPRATLWFNRANQIAGRPSPLRVVG